MADALALALLIGAAGFRLWRLVWWDDVPWMRLLHRLRAVWEHADDGWRATLATFVVCAWCFGLAVTAVVWALTWGLAGMPVPGLVLPSAAVVTVGLDRLLD